MTASNVLNLQQSTRAGRAAAPTATNGSWKLAAGRAITLEPRESGSLRVMHGGLWLTASHLPGDHFLQAGQIVHLHPGQRAVIEPWNPGTRSAGSYFNWEAHVQAQAVAADRGRPINWAADLAQLRGALAGLRAPLGLAFVALGRLARAVVLAGAQGLVGLVRGRHAAGAPGL